MSYKDKDKQREADRLRQKRRRDKIKAKGVTIEGGVTNQAVTAEASDITVASPPQTMTDAELLNSWAAGNGTEYQRRMGVLANHYPLID